MSDSVKHPRHYNTSKIEVWDAIIEWGLGFILGNVVKYVVRADHKYSDGGMEDLMKAKFYLEKEIKIRKKLAKGEIKPS